LCLTGGSGTGETRLLMSLATLAAEAGYRVPDSLHDTVVLCLSFLIQRAISRPGGCAAVRPHVRRHRRVGWTGRAQGS